jgi:hypothetical protein
MWETILLHATSFFNGTIDESDELDKEWFYEIFFDVLNPNL